jgi:hypothetical protein
MKYKLIGIIFPKVPFLTRYDYWNGLATHRTITVISSLQAIRSRFHRLAFIDSACFAASSPVSAVLENAIVEVAQGTTYFCSNKNYCICDFGTQDEPRTCEPYHSFASSVIRNGVQHISPIGFHPIFDVIPLSAYTSEDFNSEVAL